MKVLLYAAIRAHLLLHFDVRRLQQLHKGKHRLIIVCHFRDIFWDGCHMGQSPGSLELQVQMGT